MLKEEGGGTRTGVGSLGVSSTGVLKTLVTDKSMDTPVKGLGAETSTGSRVKHSHMGFGFLGQE